MPDFRPSAKALADLKSIGRFTLNYPNLARSHERGDSPEKRVTTGKAVPISQINEAGSSCPINFRRFIFHNSSSR